MKPSWKHTYCCNALMPTQHVFSTAVNMDTTNKSMHQMWCFTILKPKFHHKNEKRIKIQLNRQVRKRKTVKLRPVKSKWICLSKFPSYLVSFSTTTWSMHDDFFSHGFQWLLLAAITVEVVYTMHDGQDLKHPLDQASVINWRHWYRVSQCQYDLTSFYV